ncbi:MAG: hypothetical protein KC502_11175, partial [Myxococcales bacterium]|nr:hypothetical protein [Myxococcales bacterium]
MLIGRVFADRYRVEALRADGPYGQAYKAWRVDNAALVELHVLWPEISGSSGASERFYQLMERYSQLRSVAVRTPIDFGVADDRSLYFVYDLIERPTLAEAVAGGEGLPADRVAEIGRSVAEAIGSLHDAGLTHGGLTARCVTLVGGAASVKVGFSGMSEFLARAPLPDERIAGLDRDLLGLIQRDGVRGTRTTGGAPPSDIHALGALLFRAATGASLYDVLHDAMPTPAGRDRAIEGALSGVQDDLAEVVRAATSERRDGRFQSARAIAGALQSLFDDSGDLPPPHPSAAPLERPPPAPDAFGRRPSSPELNASPRLSVGTGTQTAGMNELADAGSSGTTDDPKAGGLRGIRSFGAVPSDPDEGQHIDSVVTDLPDSLPAAHGARASETQRDLGGDPSLVAHQPEDLAEAETVEVRSPTNSETPERPASADNGAGGGVVIRVAADMQRDRLKTTIGQSHVEPSTLTGGASDPWGGLPDEAPPAQRLDHDQQGDDQPPSHPTIRSTRRKTVTAGGLPNTPADARDSSDAHTPFAGSRSTSPSGTESFLAKLPERVQVRVNSSSAEPAAEVVEPVGTAHPLMQANVAAREPSGDQTPAKSAADVSYRRSLNYDDLAYRHSSHMRPGNEGSSDYRDRPLSSDYYSPETHQVPPHRVVPTDTDSEGDLLPPKPPIAATHAQSPAAKSHDGEELFPWDDGYVAQNERTTQSSNDRSDNAAPASGIGKAVDDSGFFQHQAVEDELNELEEGSVSTPMIEAQRIPWRLVAVAAVIVALVGVGTAWQAGFIRAPKQRTASGPSAVAQAQAPAVAETAAGASASGKREAQPAGNAAKVAQAGDESGVGEPKAAAAEAAPSADDPVAVAKVAPEGRVAPTEPGAPAATDKIAAKAGETQGLGKTVEAATTKPGETPLGAVAKADDPAAV